METLETADESQFISPVFNLQSSQCSQCSHISQKTDLFLRQNGRRGRVRHTEPSVQGRSLDEGAVSQMIPNVTVVMETELWWKGDVIISG